MAKHNIDGTQIPTNIPSSRCPLNQRETEIMKLINARIAG